MAHSSGSTGGTDNSNNNNNNSLQQLISPQELNDRFNEVLSMVRGERNRTELDVNEYIVTKESLYWDDFLKSANVPPNKVEPNEYKDFLLRCGDTLRKLGEPLAASELYYFEYIKRYSLNAGTSSTTISENNKEEKTAKSASRQDILRYILVVYGKSECDKELLLQNDSSLIFKKTVENFLDILNGLRQAMNVCLTLGKMYTGNDSLYWLIHDGCVLVANLCDPIVVAGYGSQVAEFYVWCILSLEVFVELSTVKYLKFHVSLYIRCCQAYDSYDNISNALRCAKRGLKIVNQLASEEAMDPPVPEPVLNKLAICRTDLSSLIFKYESMTKMFSHLEKINSGEEEALEAIEPVDPRKPVEEEDKESGKMDLFPLNEFGQSYLDMCKSTFGINLKGVSNSEANADEDGGGEAEDGGEQETAVTDDIIIQGLLEASHDNSLRVLKPSSDLKVQAYRSTNVRIIMSMIGKSLRKELIKFRDQKSFTVAPCDDIISLKWHVGLARLACNTGCTWFEASVIVKSLLARLAWSPEELDDTEVPPYTDPNNIVVNFENKTDMERDLIYEIQLLDTFLELEHSDECEMAIYVAPPPAKEEVEGEEQEGVEEKDESSKEEVVDTTMNGVPKPSPSFRIAGRQFPVQKLEAFSNALMSMVTNGDLNVLITRKDLICDATLTLWSPYCDAMLHAIDDVLEENLPIDQRLVKVLLNVLTTIHVCFDRCDVDDPILRGRVCLRLVLLLEQEGELRDAVQIVRHGVRTLEKHRTSRWNAANIVPYNDKARDSLSMSSISMIVEKDLFEDGSSDSSKRVYGLGSLLEPFDQDLGALHVDLTLAMYRVELALGSDITVKSKKHKARLKLIKERELAKNKAAGGAYQPPEKPVVKPPVDDEDEEQEEEEEEENKNVYLPASPQAESRLSGDCKKNLYNRALLILCIGSTYRPTLLDRSNMIEECIELLIKADEEANVLMEDSRFVNDGPIATTLTPNQPRFVSRSTSTITVRLTPYSQMPAAKRRKPRKIDHFRLYGKLTGAGTAVSLNNNEYKGLGIPIPAIPVDENTPYGAQAPDGLVVTVEGLIPNESYVFACAAYDKNGKVIEGIGATSIPIVTSLPLPNLLCWSYLGNIAVRKGLPMLSKRACDRVYSYFVNLKYGDGKDIWELNPLNAHQLNRELCNRTSKPVLQAFCRAIYSYADSLNSDIGVGAPAVPLQAGKILSMPLKKSLVGQQVETMRVLQRLLIAIEVACTTATEDDGSGVGSSTSRPTIGSDLVLTGVSRVYNYMLPLLQLKSKGAFLLRACATCRHALSIVPKKQWYSICQQIQTRVTYELRRIARELNEAEVLKVTATVDLDFAFDNPVSEQIALREDLNSDVNVWQNSDKGLSGKLAMVPTVEDDVGIEETVWNAVHGPATEEGEEEDANEMEKQEQQQARIVEAFGKLKEEYEKHDRYLEFICRLSKIALKLGMADFIDEWLMNNIDFDLPLPPVTTEENGEEADKKDNGGEDAEPTDPDEIDVKDLKRPVVPSIFGKIPSKIFEDEVSAIPTTARIFNDTLESLTKEMEELKAKELADKIAKGLVPKIEAKLEEVEGEENAKDEEKTDGEEKEEGGENTNENYELPREKTPSELAEEARTEPNEEEIKNLLWLSELEILRAQSIYERLSTEGTYEKDPIGSGPYTDLAPGLVDDEIEGMDGNNEGGQNQGESLVPQLSLQMGPMMGVGGPEYRLKMQKRVIDRQLLRRLLRHCAKASGRAIAGKHWAMLRTASRIAWNAINLGWVSPTEFGDTEARQAAVEEIALLTEEIKSARSSMRPISGGGTEGGSKPGTADSSSRPNSSGTEEESNSSPNSRPNTRGSQRSQVSFGGATDTDGSPVKIKRKRPAPMEFDWRPLWRIATSLIDMHNEILQQSDEDTETYLLKAGTTTYVCEIVIFTIQVLTNCNLRRELIGLGERLIEMTNKEVGTSERVLPLILHAQRQIWRRFDADLKIVELKLTNHEEAWQQQLAEKAKRRKRRLVQVGVSPEEQAYKNIKELLEGKVNEKRIIERKEFTHMDMLQRSWDELKRDKNNCQDSFDQCIKQLHNFIQISEGELGDEGLLGNDDMGSQAGGGSTRRSQKSKRSHGQSTRRTSTNMSTSRTGRTGGSKKQVDPGEPAWTRTVLKAFKKSADLLRSKQQTMLLTMLMGVLGDFHAGRPDPKRRVDAGKAWGDAIDALFGNVDVAQEWRATVKDGKILKLGNGFWGLLHGALSMSKTAQYTHVKDLSSQSDAAQFAAYLFKGMLEGSLPNPTRMAGFIRLGFNGGLREIWPGVELFGHAYSPEPYHLLSCLRHTTFVLNRDGYGLEALPVIAISEFAAKLEAKHVKYLLQCRIARIDSLILCNHPEEAVSQLQMLIQGDDLPSDLKKGPTVYNNMQADDDNDMLDPTARSAVSGSQVETARTAKSAKNEPVVEEEVDDYVLTKKLSGYKNNYPPSHAYNLKTLEWIVDMENVRLTGRMKSIYGLRLQHELTLARLRLMIFLGKYDEADTACISMIKDVRSGDACGTKPKPIIPDDEDQKSARTNKTGRTDGTNAGDIENDEQEDEAEVEVRPRRLIQLEIYLMCELLLLRAKIAESKRQYGHCMRLAEKACAFYSNETRLKEEAKQRAALLEAQRARHAKQTLGMSPRPLGGIAEENENDLLDDIGALDLDKDDSSNDDPTLFPGMAFWLKCRVIVARCRLALGHYDEARMSCDKGVEEADISHEFLSKRSLMIMRAQIHMSEGEVDEAKELYNVILKNGRDHGTFGLQHAESAMLLGDLLNELSLAEEPTTAAESKNEASSLYDEALNVLTERLRLHGWQGSTSNESSVLHNVYMAGLIGAYVKALLRGARSVGDVELGSGISPDDTNTRIIGGLQRVEEGLRALNHVASPKPSLSSTLSLFRGRYQRLLLPLSTDINSGFNMVVTCLKQCIEGEVNMCHNHATLRAANMELVELFGRQWIGGVEEQHKNLACKYLQDAANVAGMYGSLKGKVSAMASGDEIQGDDLEAVPVAAKSYLLEEKIRKLIATDSLPVVEDVEPAKDGEEEKEPVELEDLVTASVDQRSILLYYMSLVQTRRVADAAMANDNKFSTITEIHNYLQNNMESYKENVCFKVPPVLEEGDEETSEESTGPVIEPFSIVSQYYLATSEDANNAMEYVNEDDEVVTMQNPIALFTLLGGTVEKDENGNVINASEVEGDDAENGEANPGDLGRCIVSIDFVRKASKSFAEIRLRKPGNDKIVSVLKEIAEVLKASAMKAGMRPASDDGDVMEFYLKVISMIDDEALLVLEKLFDIDLGINAVNEGVSRWLRYCLLGEF